MHSVEQEAKSLSDHYQRGVSAWNFDIEDLKTQASLLPDGEDDESMKSSLADNCRYSFTMKQWRQLPPLQC
ncbi:hypothetical protein DITRI_Ditri03aG0116400 [Diplodiscus trichospermus]